MPQYYYPASFEGTFWTVVDGAYYVSSIGSDTNDGSPQAPFLTIQRAMEEAEDGEKIVVGPNEYVYEAPVPDGGAHIPCRVATTGNLDLSAGGLLEIDSIQTSLQDRVLVWQQTDPTENGIYAASAGSWSRVSDLNALNTTSGKLIPVLEGAQYGGKLFQHMTSGSITFGTTDIVIALASGATPKGLIDCSSNPDYPAGQYGDYYYVSVAGKIGGASGIAVRVGARIECIAMQSDGGNQATVGSDWLTQQLDDFVTKVGTPANNQIAVWTGDGTLNGDTLFTYSDDQLKVSGGSDSFPSYTFFGDEDTGLYLSGTNALGISLGGQFYWDFTPNNTYVSHNIDLNGWGTIILPSAPTTTTIGALRYNGASLQVYDGGWNTVGGGNVSKVGNPSNNEIGVWTGDGTIEGDSALTWDGSELKVGGAPTSSILRNYSLYLHDSTYSLSAALTSGGARIFTTNKGSSSDSLLISSNIGQDVNDVGSVPIIQFESREFVVGGDGYISTRPLLGFYNYDSLITKVESNGNWDFQSNNLTNLADPVSAQDAATKAYVDSEIASAGGGDVTKVGTPVNNQIGVWTGDGTIEGGNDLTWDGASSVLSIQGHIGAQGNIQSQGDIESTAGHFILGDDQEIKLGDSTDVSIDYDSTGNDLVASVLSANTDILFKTGATTRFTFDMGTYKGTATDWIATSDERLKDSFGSFGSVLSKIQSLKGKFSKFKWRESGVEDVGYGAQTIQEVFPELVDVNDKNILGLSYGKLGGIALEGVAEVNDEVTELKRQIAELRKIIENVTK